MNLLLFGEVVEKLLIAFELKIWLEVISIRILSFLLLNIIAWI
tara:strand:- start:349 stop:477 length:129 start_codon:yes stop_codon:yes gene_type:complete